MSGSRVLADGLVDAVYSELPESVPEVDAPGLASRLVVAVLRELVAVGSFERDGEALSQMIETLSAGVVEGGEQE